MGNNDEIGWEVFRPYKWATTKAHFSVYEHAVSWARMQALSEEAEYVVRRKQKRDEGCS
jgi:hypothetical protein